MITAISATLLHSLHHQQFEFEFLMYPTAHVHLHSMALTITSTFEISCCPDHCFIIPALARLLHLVATLFELYLIRFPTAAVISHHVPHIITSTF
jgi:hypothetical protein